MCAGDVFGSTERPFSEALFGVGEDGADVDADVVGFGAGEGEGVVWGGGEEDVVIFTAVLVVDCQHLRNEQ